MTQNFKSGDFVFLDEKSGKLASAISDVTCRQFKVSEPKLSHMGILFQVNRDWFVYESRERVRKTPFEDFIRLAKEESPETKGWYWTRAHSKLQNLIPKCLDWISNQLETPYNHQYISNEKSYYCAELTAEAFRYANGGEPVFAYRPMYFGEQNDPSFLVWKEHFQRLNQQIPIGKNGISPLAIYLDPQLQILR